MVDKSRLVIVPADSYEEVIRRLEDIREKDEPKQLELDCERLKEEVAVMFGHEASRKELKDGHRYGCLIYSVSANAVRNGRVIPNHGEIYLTVWVYRAKDDLFYQKNAWDVISTKRTPGLPIIELK